MEENDLSCTVNKNDGTRETNGSCRLTALKKKKKDERMTT